MESEPCLQNGERPNVSPESVQRNKKRPVIRVSGPDGLGAWCVAFSACLINFVVAGLGRMSGIMYIAFMDRYHTDRKTAATPFSVRSSTRSLLGPVVGILGQKYGVRAVTVFGGIIGTLGSAACFFASDMVWITILWGGINGIGTSMTTTLAQVVIEQYFQKHRTTASGMAFSGGCVGAFLFPVLLEQLLQLYALEGTFLIIGGIMMHTIPAAMILKKPPWLRNKTNGAPKINQDNCLIEEKELDKEVIVDQKTMDKSGSRRNSNLMLKINHSGYLTSDVDIEYLRQNVDVVVQLLKLNLTLEKSSQRSLSREVNQNEFGPSEITDILQEIERAYYISDKAESRQLLKPEFKNSARNRLIAAETSCRKSQSFHLDAKSQNFQNGVCENLSTPDISKIEQTLSNEPCIMQKIKELCSMKESKILAHFPNHKKNHISTVLEEIRKLNDLNSAETRESFISGSFYDLSGDTLVNIKAKSDKSTDLHPNTFWEHFKTALNLHKNPLFLLICLCRAVHFITFIPVVTIIVDFSMDQGLAEDDGKYVIGALSLGDLLGRLCLGWITDYGYVGLSNYILVMMLLQGVSTATMPLFLNRVGLLVNLAVFGMLQGSIFIRHPVCVFRYVRSHEKSIAMGCINFFAGFLGFALPFYIGYFRDVIGSYNCIFYINGSISIFVGSLWLFEPYLVENYIPKDENAPEAV